MIFERIKFKFIGTMKIRRKFIVLLLVFISASAVFIAGRKRYNGDVLSIKNIEALADDESGWGNCVEVQGYCRFNGEIISFYLDTRE